MIDLIKHNLDSNMFAQNLLMLQAEAETRT